MLGLFTFYTIGGSKDQNNTAYLPNVMASFPLIDHLYLKLPVIKNDGFSPNNNCKYRTGKRYIQGIT